MAKGIVIQISGDGEGAKRALEMVRDQLKQTQHEASTTAEVIERLKSTLETVGLYMGIREAVDILKEMTAGSAEFGEQMQKASVKTGMTVDTLSVLHYAADLAHTDFDGLQGGIGKMAVNMEAAANGNTKLAATFRAAGIDVKELSKQQDGVDQAFRKIATTLANTENAQKRDALAKGLMGKAGVELIPVLRDLGSNFDELSAGAEKAGVKLDALRAQRLAALDDELDKLKENVKGAGLEFTDGLAPGLIKVFDILGQGQTQEEIFRHWGEGTASLLARLAALAYDFASAMERAFSLTEGGKLSSIGKHDWESADQLLAKGRELEELANQISSGKLPSNASTGPSRKGGPGFEGAGGTAKPGKSGNPIDEARAQLAQEQARLRLEIVKAEGQAQLAELDVQHKMLLVSDQEFFDQRFALQNKEYDAEQRALEARQKTLQDLETKQHGDKLLKRDKSGSSAEELRTQKELVQVQEQLAALTAKRKSTESGYNAEVNASNIASELAGLKAAAMLEKERNSGIEAQIALLRREGELEAQKAKVSGVSEQGQADVRAQTDLAVAKLRVSDAGQQINDTESEYRRLIDDVNDRASKGYISQSTTKRQIAKLHKDEAAALQELVEKYQQLAAETGDSTLVEKAKDAQEQLNQLKRPDLNDTFGKKLTDGMQQMSQSIAENAALGRQSFGEMAKGILDDIDRMALKMAEEKFLAPLFENLGNAGASSGDSSSGGGFGGWISHLFGAGGEHHRNGGVGSDMPQIVGDEHGDGEIWTPPTRGGTYTTNAMLKSLAEKGGSGGRVPNVTTNVVNQSSQPVTATTLQPSFDSQLREMVTHVFLTDLHEGGQIAQGLGR